VGCGYISHGHLAAYREAGWDVSVLCNRTREKAEARRKEYYPDADVCTDYYDVLRREDVDVVVLTPHPKQRESMLTDAIAAGKHVLSQKPFAADIDFAEEVVEQAESRGVKLAVHQPYRWNLHNRYAGEALLGGHLGEPTSVHLTHHFNHEIEILDTNFEKVPHSLLFDLAIHYFDYVRFVLDEEPRCVSANLDRAPAQTAKPPLLGQAIMEFDERQASVIMDGHTKVGQERRTYLTGTEGAAKIHTDGSGYEERDETTTWIDTGDGFDEAPIDSEDYSGMIGSLGELLCAIEEDRKPIHSGRDNLASLELCVAAVGSAEDGEPKVPGDVREIPGNTL
jgi:predicted dehydrogenase